MKRWAGMTAEEIRDAEANAFAMCLLMPEHLLRADLAEKPKLGNGRVKLTDADVHALAKRYEVDVVIMTLRLVQLGVLRG